MKQIATLDQLIEHAVMVCEKNATWEGVELLPGCATITIRTCGVGWDKSIDARGARLVVDMQGKIDTLFASLSGGEVKAPLIKVKIEEGSNEIYALFEEAIKVGIANLSPEDIKDLFYYALTYIGGIWGVLKFTSTVVNYLKHRTDSKAAIEEKKLERAHELELKKLEQEAARRNDELMALVVSDIGTSNRKIVETFATAMEKFSAEKRREQIEKLEEFQKIGNAVTKLSKFIGEDIKKEVAYGKPIKSYMASLPEEDRLSIAGLPPMRVERIKPFYRARRRPRSDQRYAYCDQQYSCTGLDLELADPRLKLTQEGVSVLAFLRIDEEARKKLLVQIENRIKNKTVPFNLDLQTDVNFNAAGIKKVAVVGIGTPRVPEENHCLLDFPGNIRKSFEIAVKRKEE